ncbi:MAG: sarcosine oxidase subunit alpha family protein [Rhodobacteraceae bacterium]|nr:sarcosine oxidase subunit alpha family protein [Paracoccaceae bacterium]
MSTRLASGGRLIDRRRKLGFRFNGNRMAGFAGDSLASALLAGGQVLVGRSFKYHRRRGIVASGPEEPNALVTLGSGDRLEPNRQATMTELYEGMVAVSQNHWPTLEADFGAAAGWVSRFLPAGFYYKTFMRPQQAWKRLYEPVIRRAAGLGRAPGEADPDHYEHFNLSVDLVIVGGGIAGLVAAQAAAESGARTLLIEQMPHWGGRAPVELPQIDNEPADAWVAATVAGLCQDKNIHLLNRTTLVGMYDHGFALAVERVSDHCPSQDRVRQRIWRIRARRFVLATGALERPLCFQGNDLPGVMLASAVRDYAVNYGVSVGDRTVLAVNNDDAYRTAITLAEAGLSVPVILDSRATAEGELPDRARQLHIRVECGRAIASIKGRGRVRGVRICSQAGEGAVLEEIECEAVAMSGGWSPAAHLWSHCGGKQIWNRDVAAYRPDPGCPPIDAAGDALAYVCGAAAGVMTADRITENALAMASSALNSIGHKGGSTAPMLAGEVQGRPDALCLTPSGVSAGNRAGIWVDFQNDVKVSDLELAVREGFESSEHAKRFTTLGMATDQGKLSNINGLMILSENLGMEIAEVRATTFRPPYTPVTLGAIAGDARGRFFKPVRKTPMDEWHGKNGAFWEPVGDWRRPFCYLRDGESVSDAVNRESLQVRQSAGLLDASTLGKILVKGPDAGKFLDMLYTNMMSSLRPGHCRYGLMCNENGFLMDDGVVARIDETSFICHTTTGGADHIHAWVEEWLQCEWWDWQVYTANLTDQFAQIGIAGPESRKILQEVSEMRFGADDLPFMTWSDGQVDGVDARVFRISFSGELSYEIAVPSSDGPAVWESVLSAGAAYGLAPYGTEALHVLRAEKGFIMIGEETDGTVTPQDLGLDWAVSKKKEDFIGKRAQERPFLCRPGRWKFVGIETVDANAELESGSHAVGEGTSSHGYPNIIGRVTSSYHSPVLNRRIALGLIENGPEMIGKTLKFMTKEGTVDARITSPVFYDPEGSQLRG